MSEEEKKAAEEAAKVEEAKNKKAEEKPAAFTQADIDKALEKERSKFKDYDELKKERDALKKEKLDEHEKAILDAKEEKEKEFEPTKQRMSKLEETIKQLLELEIADIPEDKRKHIPEFDSPEAKLAWLKAAKADGFFGTPKKDSSTGSKPGDSPKGEPEKIDNVKLAKEDPEAYAKYLRNHYGISNIRLADKKKTK